MARSVRVIVLNSDESYAPELRAKLLKNEGVKIVAEVDEPAMFPSALDQFSAELAVINLDGDPDTLVRLASEVHSTHGLTFFAVSESNDADLILKSMRAGIREFLVRPIDDEQLGEAIERLAKAATTATSTGKLICVFGSNGGCGATALAVNLAGELAQLGRKRTVVVDLDFAFGHVAAMLDASPQFTIADLCHTMEAVDPSMVEKALVRHENGLMILSRPLHFTQAEQITAANTANVLTTLCEMYEYVVCDGPLRYDGGCTSVLELADITIMLVNLVVPSVRNVNRILQGLSREGYNLDRVKLVANRHTTDSSTLDISDVEECLSRRVDFIVPDEPKTISAAINMGQLLLTSAPKSKVREVIHQIATIIHNPNGDDETAAVARQGLLAKVFSR